MSNDDPTDSEPDDYLDLPADEDAATEDDTLHERKENWFTNLIGWSGATAAGDLIDRLFPRAKDLLLPVAAVALFIAAIWVLLTSG